MFEVASLFIFLNYRYCFTFIVLIKLTKIQSYILIGITKCNKDISMLFQVDINDFEMNY